METEEDESEEKEQEQEQENKSRRGRGRGTTRERGARKSCRTSARRSVGVKKRQFHSHFWRWCRGRDGWVVHMLRV